MPSWTVSRNRPISRKFPTRAQFFYYPLILLPAMTDSNTTLTGRERRALKSRAKTLAVSVRFGRKGLTETALRELSRSLDLGDGLAKVAFGGDREQRAVQVGEVEEKLGAVCVAQVGKTAAFHRPVAT
ncbi:MAG: hypothetical protein CMI31_09085 [Opitutae bacterium]|nr:hypothetical protein [Opitutae bacterium]